MTNEQQEASGGAGGEAARARLFEALAPACSPRMRAFLIGVLAQPTEETPRYGTSATITSDGFLIGGFVDADDEFHMGAFLGDFSDHQRNIRGLVDHVGLTGSDRLAVLAAFERWCGRMNGAALVGASGADTRGDR
jgi:hypothetical protein